MNNDKEKLLEELKKQIEQKKEEKVEEIVAERPKDIVAKDVGLKSQIRDLNEKMEMLVGKKGKELKKKRFKLPGSVKRKLKKLAKKSMVQVMLLQHNRNIKPTIGEIKEGMLFIGDKIYDGSTDSVWLWNGKIPTTIVSEWDLKPLTSNRLYKKTMDENSISHPQTIMIRAMELYEATQGSRPKLGGKAIIWILIGGAVVVYILFGNQGG